jgi:hypothetical protein
MVAHQIYPGFMLGAFSLPVGLTGAIAFAQHWDIPVPWPWAIGSHSDGANYDNGLINLVTGEIESCQLEWSQGAWDWCSAEITKRNAEYWEGVETCEGTDAPATSQE